MGERRWAASEETYRILVENAFDGINIVDREGNFVFVNPEYCRMLGYSSEELLGKSFLTTLSIEDRGVGMKRFKKAVNEHMKPCTYEGKNVRKDGSIIDVQNKWNYVYRDGKVNGTMAIIRDITERKVAEQKIRGIINAAPDVIHVLSPDMRIINRNTASKKLFPHIREGDHCYEAIHKRDRACAHCGVTKVFENGKKHEHESTITALDGKKIIVHSPSSPIFDEKGQIIAAVEILRDITERKMAEKELKKYAREIEHSNQLKDLFIDIMRHDLLGHVGIIENSSEIILDEESDSEKRELILIINESADRLIELIEDASEYAMLEELKGVDLKTFDIDGALKDVLEFYEPQAKGKNITVEYHAGRGRVFKASPLIKDVLSNLLSNAIKYSPENTKVAVEIQKGPPCTITVKDSGPGIPNKEKERIFERFRRIRKRGVKGTGLGLAIVKRIVDLHNGRVWVDDNPEGGSIFKVEIPT